MGLCVVRAGVPAGPPSVPAPLEQWLLQMAVVQYLVVRGDLLAALGWPLGAVMAQACHAATAAIHNHYRCNIMSEQELQIFVIF